VKALSAEQGLALFDAAIASPRAHVVPVRLDMAGLRGQDVVPPLLRALVRTRARRVASNTGLAGGGGLAGRLAMLSVADRGRALTELVRAQAAVVLGHGDADAVDSDRAFKSLGFDSLTAVELRNRLGTATGLKLPVTAVFDHPTPAALAIELESLLGLNNDPARQPAVPTAQAGTAGTDDDLIAIVGMSCRFPGGVRSPEDLWQLLAEERDAMTPYPTDRGWDVGDLGAADSPDTVYERVGGFLHDVADFDPEFFGISPREALAMDPQQRLLLETTWEALERAGIDPTTLHGTPTGVFAGLIYNDYAARFPNLLSGFEGYLGNGSANSVASGRVAYALGLEGPAITVDTACSSSLVALHLAAQALRQGECTLAVAGGVTAMATPRPMVEFSQVGGLAPDGRCKAFGAGADGMGFAEGVGMLVVERLSDARRHGHPVLAVLRGSALNQDGASNGLTAPSGPAQERVIRQALANAGMASSEVDVVEAHGTGTALGDPIEAQALMATYGQDRPEDQPFLLGSVKSNIGHTQAAAGVAGVIKMVMAMRHGVVPRTLHVERPTSHVEWSAGAVRLAADSVPWPKTGRPRRGAVSSFGISGTNAHVIVEQLQEQSADDVPDAPAGLPVPWVLSARSPESLREQARSLHRWVAADPAFAPADIARSLVTTRTTFGHRVVMVGRTREDFLRQLSAVEHGEPVTGLVEGISAPRTKTVFVFPGQGSQWAGMAAVLLDTSPVFAEHIDRCAAALRPHTDWSLLDVLREHPDAPSLDRVDVVQPVLWAVMVSLAQVWRSHGVHPDAVVGHSQGELAAACVSGVLSLADAARIVALRSRLIGRELAGQGGMVSLPLPMTQVVDLLEPWGERICVATVNGPNSTVVAGEPEALDELMADCERDGVRARRIPVDYASHTPQVERLREPLMELAGPIVPRPGDLPMYSAVTGELLDAEDANAEYWYRNLRETVRFEQVTRTLLASGHEVFVEVSPHPVLINGIEETLKDHETGIVATGTLRRDRGDRDRLLTALAELFVTGVAVDWPTTFEGGRPVELPTYAFHRQRYWLDAPAPSDDPSPRGGGTVDDQFWAAVEREDFEGLASTLAVADAGGEADIQSSLTALLPVLSAWRRQRSEQDTVDSWRYGIEWTPVPDAGSAPLTGTWLLVVPDGFEEDRRVFALAEGIERRGASAVPIVLPSQASVEEPSERTADLADHLRSVLGAHSDVSGVLSLTAWDERPHPTSSVVPRGYADNLALIQALDVAGADARLWCVTTGAVTTGAHDAPVVPAQALVWGLGRVAAQELPDRWGGLIDVPADPDEHAMTRLCGLLAGESGEDQIAVRATGLLARRLARTPAPTGGTDEWTATGTALITGGTGAIGGHVARWLAARGAEHLMLLSRRGPEAEGAEELRADLIEAGARVSIIACDAGDREALAAALADVPDEFPLTAVFHTAAVLDDGRLDTLTVPRADATLRAKAGAAWNLHELTEHLDLSAFVLFSSTAGTFGAAGQGNYAPGNAFLDALAWHRRARKQTATSIAWGAWAQGGMAEKEAVVELRRRHGVPAMSPQLATLALRKALDADDTVVVLADIDWDRFYLAYTAARPSPLLHGLDEIRHLQQRAVTDGRPGTVAAGPTLAERLAGLSRPEQERLLRDTVRTHAAVVLGHDGPDAVPVKRPFWELGLDSVTAVQLRNRLGGVAGRKLPAGLVFDYPTVSGLVGYLRGELCGDAAETNPLMSDLDRLDNALAGLPDDDPTRSEVAERLEKLLRRVSPVSVVMQAPARELDLDGASHDEVFALIDEELGEA
ncbi:type I polyketide synthase, partial [Streptomyces sp. HB132]|uniref:type I polyketide synthase n=1 Tax=Streptomyces sp. HB132 TaxID=767388 RepID=UPI0035A8B5CD